MISNEKVVAIVSPDSAPAKRTIGEAKEKGKIIDCTSGRRTKSVILTQTDHVILSALSLEVLSSRFNEAKAGEDN